MSAAANTTTLMTVMTRGGGLRRVIAARNGSICWIDVATYHSYNICVISWDERKRNLNLKKHGIDFADAEALFDGPTVTVEDARLAYGEQRLVTLGILNG